VTNGPGRLIRSDTSLEGGAALDLYFAQLSRDLIKMTEQSALLLLAFAEHLTLLREMETGKAAAAVARTLQNPNADDLMRQEDRQDGHGPGPR
jgi:hypothetical protein